MKMWLILAVLLFAPLTAKADGDHCVGKRDALECLKTEQAQAEKKMQAALAEQQKMAGSYEGVFGGQREKLEKSQKAYLKYREAECDYQSKEFDPRKLDADAAQQRVEELRLACMIRLTQKRTEWLSASGK